MTKFRACGRASSDNKSVVSRARGAYDFASWGFGESFELREGEVHGAICPSFSVHDAGCASELGSVSADPDNLCETGVFECPSHGAYHSWPEEPHRDRLRVPGHQFESVRGAPPVNNFNDTTGPQLASRGYRELLLNHGIAGPKVGYESIAPAIGQAIKYARSLPGVDTVLLLGHVGIGGALVAFYENVAENGPGVCQGPEKIYPCRGDLLKDLPKADGVIFADVHPGEAFRLLSYLDPAVTDEAHPLMRNPSLDMFAAANGYDRIPPRARRIARAS